MMNYKVSLKISNFSVHAEEMLFSVCHPEPREGSLDALETLRCTQDDTLDSLTKVLEVPFLNRIIRAILHQSK
jgi:hypothetical protein